MNQQKPDLPLRTLTQLLRALLASPLGIVALRATRSLAGRKEEDNWFEVTSLNLVLPRLDPAFHGYRLIQISDFHIGTWLTRRHLEQVVSQVNGLQPDLVAITGDFVSFNPQYYSKDLAEPLSLLAPRDGKLAVLGNHDHWTDPEVIREVLRYAGITELNNRVVTIQRGNSSLHLAGIDDYMDGHDRLEDVLSALPGDGQACILLAHEPDFALKSGAAGRFDLQISGHSHGGQIRLPVIGSPFLPRHARKYPRGLYQVKDMILYTNRGLGTDEFNIRWNCKPEITVFNLESPKQTEQMLLESF